MKNLESKEILFKILNNMIETDNKNLYLILDKELIENGKMTNGEVQRILSHQIDLNNINVEILVWFYSAIIKYVSNLPKLEDIFEKEEIKRSELFQIKRIEKNFPLKFPIYDKLSRKDEFLTSLSIQEINEMQKNGIIILDSEMSRESIITNYKGQLISNISYNDARAREIGKAKVSCDYHPNAIRLHLLDKNADFNVGDSELIVRSGSIVLIDGNHRLKGTEYALLENENIYEHVPILFTIGNINMAQDIIYQEEKREPFKKEHVETYKKSAASNIVKNLVFSVGEDLDGVYKFCNTKQAIKEGAGFILESILIQYIEKYYGSDMSKNQEKATTKWLIDFFNALADILQEDFKNYYQLRNSKWSVSQYAFVGFIQLSKALQGKEDWETLLSQFISKINFDYENKPWKTGVLNKDKVIDEKFKGMIDNEFSR